LKCAVGVADPTPERADVWTVVEVSDRRGEYIVQHDRVRVQQEYVSPGRDLQSDVAASGETEILAAAEEVHRRKRVLHHFRRAVG
jgi:hypothetical protein